MMGFLVMQKLALQKQDNLITLALQCKTLQEVDLSGCESLTNSKCDVFSDGGAILLYFLIYTKMISCQIHILIRIQLKGK
jgi:hypothetical protein